MIRIISLAVVLLLAVFWATLAGGEDRNPRAGAKVPAAVELKEIRGIQLHQDRLILADVGTGKRKEVPVALVEMIYQSKLLLVTEGKAREKWSGYLFCYELRSRDSAALYTWAVWSSSPLGRFRLLSGERGENYLAWIDVSDVGFAEVSKPRDRCGALYDHFSPKAPADIVYVPVGDLVPEVDFWGVNAFYSDITILSVAKDKAGNWVVKISDPSGKKVFTLVSGGDKRENWRKK